jgi:sec-independent protein translocase protein TatA
MPSLGPVELIVVLAIVIVIFGAGRLADLGGALGRGINEFRGAVGGGDPADPRVCRDCSAAAPSDAQFCGSCGRRLIEPTRAA